MNFNSLRFGQLSVDFYWLLAEKVVLLLLKLLFSSLCALWLGKAQFGEFSYLLSIVFFSTTLYALGIGRILIRELTAHPLRTTEVLVSSFWARLGFSCLLWCLLLPSLFYFSQTNDQAWLIALLLLANISYAANVYEFWFQLKGRNQILVKFRLFGAAGFTALKLFILWRWPVLEYLVAAHMLELVTMNLGYYLLFRRYASTDLPSYKLNLSWRWFDWSLLKPIMQQSGYLLLSSMAVMLYLRMDVVMLQHMQGSDAVADYSVAVQFSEIWYSIPTIVFIVLAPGLLRLHQDQPGLYYQKLQSVMNALFVGSLIFSGLMLVAASVLIPLLFGEEFRFALDILHWHIWAGVLVALREGLSQWLVSERFAEFSLFSHLGGALINFVMNLWLIPVYGPLGAAWATCCAYLFSTFVCLLFLKRTRPIATMMLRAVLSPVTYISTRLTSR